MTTRNRFESVGPEVRLPFTGEQIATLAAHKPGDTISWQLPGSDDDAASRVGYESNVVLPLRATMTVVEDPSKGPAGQTSAAIDSLPELNFQGLPADFVLIRRIGKGGQGEVWEAWQSSLMRRVAVKFQTSGSTRTFLQEAYTTGELDHPNIVPVYELGRASIAGSERPLLAMKLVGGRPWDDIISEERRKQSYALEPFLARHLRILIDACNAVEFAHSKGIIHRDLKPAQVIVGDFGEVLLTDWGLAISVAEPEAPLGPTTMPKFRTRDSAQNRCGTPVYMAPEQTQEDSSNLGVHTDVYLLGAILFELIAGYPPHDGASAEEAFRMAMVNDVLPLPEECPEALRKLVHQALMGNPALRPQSVRELREGIEDYLSGSSRQRESRDLTRTVQEHLEEHGLHTYEEFAQAEQKLARAVTLWPGNPSAVSLQENVRLAHTRLAIDSGDLALAKALASGLYFEDKRATLLAEVTDLETRAAKHLEQRRRLRLILRTIGTAFIALAIMFAIRERQQARIETTLREQAEQAESRARRESDVAREAMQRALSDREAARRSLRTARVEQYFASIGFADAAIRDGRYDVARQTLMEPPRDLRHWEWGRLIDRSQPDLLTLPDNAGFLIDARYMPGGQKILTVTGSQTLRLWDAETGRELHTVHRPDAIVTSASPSPDGSQLLVSYNDNKTRLLSSTTGETLRTFEGVINHQMEPVFTPDGKRCLTFRFGETVVWDIETGKAVSVLSGHINVVSGANFSPGGTRVISISRDNTVRIWDVATGKSLVTLQGMEALIQGALLSPNERRVATYHQDGTAALWSTTNGELLALIEGHKDWVTAASFSPNGAVLATASRDGSVRLWDAETGLVLEELAGHRDEVRSIAFDDVGKRLVTASRDRTVRVWDATSGLELNRFAGHLLGATRARFSPDGERVVSASEDGTARVWLMDDESLLPTKITQRTSSEEVVRGPEGIAIRFSTQYKRSDDPQTAIVWDSIRGREIAQLTGHRHGILAADFSADGSRVLTASWDSTVILWDSQTGRILTTFDKHGPGGVRCVRFSPDGLLAVSGGNDRTARVWNPRTGEEKFVLRGHLSWITDAAFSPDGSLIVTASGDRMVRVWDATTGEEVATLSGHSNEVLSAAFHPDSQRVVTASADGTVKLWEPESGREILTIGNLPHPITSARFTADGTRIVGISPDYPPLTWHSIPWVHGSDTEGPLCMSVEDRVEYWKRLARLGGGIKPHDVLWIYAALPAEARPLSNTERIRIADGTPIRILCRTPAMDDERGLFIAGDTPDLGNWTPNKVRFDYRGETVGGHLWSIDLTYHTMNFKYTYGREGDGWSGSEEWGGEINRTLPDPAAPIYEMPDKSLVMVTEFGIANRF